MRFPWEGKTFQLQAAFSTAQAVTPGQGQTVRVSGVRVGDITKVGLKDGHAVVTLDLDPQYKDLVHTDAHALLRPKTGLKDMFIELDPGTRSRAAGQARVDAAGLQHAARRQPRRDPRLAGLRHARLPHAAGRRRRARPEGPRQRPARGLPALRAHAPRPGPRQRPGRPAPPEPAAASCTRWATSTTSWPARATSSPRWSTPRRPSSAPSPPSRPTSRARCGDLPGALRQTTDTLGRVQRFAKILRPAAVHLPPAFKALNRANGAVQPFAKEAAPIVQRPDPAVRARLAAGRAHAQAAGQRARRRDARADELVHGAQPPVQPRRLQPQRPRGPGQGRPRGGLPVLDGVAAAQRRRAVLDLRRQRAVPPGDPGRHVRRAQVAGRARTRR